MLCVFSRQKNCLKFTDISHFANTILPFWSCLPVTSFCLSRFGKITKKMWPFKTTLKWHTHYAWTRAPCHAMYGFVLHIFGCRLLSGAIQPTRNILSTLPQVWANVEDVAPALSQGWANRICCANPPERSYPPHHHNNVHSAIQKHPIWDYLCRSALSCSVI